MNKWIKVVKSAVQTNEYVGMVLDKFAQKHNLKLEKDGRVRRYYSTPFFPNSYILFRYDGNMYTFGIVSKDNRGSTTYETNNNDLIKALIEFENKLTSKSRLYKNYNKQQEEQKKQEMQPKQQDERITLFSIELFDNQSDVQISEDFPNLTEEKKAIDKYREDKDIYIDQDNLSGEGRIIRYDQDEDGNMYNVKVIKTFWL